MTTKIFIGNLSHEATEADLRPPFEKYGSVSECAVLSSYGFVHMDNEDEAQAAIDGLNGYNICGLRIRVEISHGKKGDGPKRGRGGGGFRGGPRGSGRGGGRGRDGPRGGGRPSPYDRYPPPSSAYYDRYDPYSRYPAYPERDYYRPLPPPERYGRLAPRDRYAERDLPERYPSPYDRERMPARDARSAYPSERMFERPAERDPYYSRERAAAADYYRQDAEPSPRTGINGTPVNNGYDSYRPLRASAGYGDTGSSRGYGRAPANSQAELQTEPIYF